MKKLLFLILIASMFGITPIIAQDCTNCFDDGPDGCGKLGYWDSDGDGFGSGPQMCFFGANPSNYAPKGTDCNDNNSSVYPRKFYIDNDGDGYGSSFSTLICQGSSTPPAGYATNGSDCDDTNPNLTVQKYWFADVDNDTFGNSSTAYLGCSPPVSMTNPTTVGGDYDDSTSLITNVPPKTFYYDGDNDDFGISTNTKYQSFAPNGYVEDLGDCDDSNPNINPNTVWYLDADGDGLGVSSIYNKVQCLQPPSDANGSYVLSNNDLCPNEYGSQNNNGCSNLNPINAGDVDKNWVWSIAYDPTGTIKSNGIHYYDELGRNIQNQNIDIKTGKLWASSTLYDSDSNPALTTFGAPIGSLTEFNYKDNFIQKTDNGSYGATDFETNEQNPAVVGKQSNTLGWYYSDNNTSEPYQDATDYPFARTVYSKLNPGSPLRVVGGNKTDMDQDGDVDSNDGWPQVYSFLMGATDELTLASAFNDSNYSNYEIVKTVSRNVHGDENVVFTDLDGKVLAMARSGGSSVSSNMRLYIGAQGYVNVHIPKGVTGFTLNNTSLVTVYDLITEQPISGSTQSLPNGFYRVAVNNLDIYTPNGIYVDYKVNYYDYTLNEYDSAGRLTDSYQALDKLHSQYSYDTFGRLVHSTTPDHGEAWFKYRKDGQIRFSQNTKQKYETNPVEFSYTNYDTFGRAIESGVLVSTAFDSANPDSETLPSGTKKEVLNTVYDYVNTSELNTLPTAYRTPTFLSGNVAKTSNANSSTYYSYDIYGRVKWMVQNIAGVGFKSIDYEYDDVSGMVYKVYYQKGVGGEQFIHRYTYNET
ncbi:MAG: RHS repeat domain-containing protein, partial [Bacteroidota bacterium]|nr:RHS repeat domain-containing protein [Bacteroidota bacterium]